ADARLPRLELVPRQLANVLAELADPDEVEARLDAPERAKGERDLADVRIARPLPHAVDRPVDPARAGPGSRDRVRRGEPKVVVAVKVDGDAEPPSSCHELVDGLGG